MPNEVGQIRFVIANREVAMTTTTPADLLDRTDWCGHSWNMQLGALHHGCVLDAGHAGDDHICLCGAARAELVALR